VYSNHALTGKSLCCPHRRLSTCAQSRRKRAKRAAAKRLRERGPAQPINTLVAFFLSADRTRLFLHFAQRTPVATTLCSCMIARRVRRPETRQRKPTPSRVLDNDHRALALHVLTNAADRSTRCQANLSAGFQWSLRLVLFSTLLSVRRARSMCRCHRRVFLLRPDAVATYHRMRALGLSRP